MIHKPARINETVFSRWADFYFEDRLNEYIQKHEAIQDFINHTGIDLCTSQLFKKDLKQWCKSRGLVLNPRSRTNNEGRILQKIKGATVEVIFIES